MEDQEKAGEIEIFYEKNPTYKTAYADGLIGGIAPTGIVSLSFYSTRSPIPKSVVHSIDEKGKLIREPIETKSKHGIIREIECGVYMSIDTAENIYDFLKKILNKDEQL